MEKELRRRSDLNFKKENLALRKIEGQIRGIIKMIEGGRNRIDILHQFMSVQSALTSVELNLLEDHLKKYVEVLNNDNSFKGEQELIKEVMNIITRVKRGKL